MSAAKKKKAVKKVKLQVDIPPPAWIEQVLKELRALAKSDTEWEQGIGTVIEWQMAHASWFPGVSEKLTELSKLLEKFDPVLVWKNVTDLSASVSKLADEQAVLTERLEELAAQFRAYTETTLKPPDNGTIMCNTDLTQPPGHLAGIPVVNTSVVINPGQVKRAFAPRT